MTFVISFLPASSDVQRSSLREACELAGLTAVRFIRQPVAAARAHGFGALVRRGGLTQPMNVESMNSDSTTMTKPFIATSKSRIALVFDLGGRTHNVALLTLEDGVVRIISSDMVDGIGGDMMDERLVEHLLTRARAQSHEADHSFLETNRLVQWKFHHFSESSKRDLSTKFETQIEISGILSDGRMFRELLKREVLEDLTRDIVRKCLKPLDRLLRDAGLTKDKIDTVLMVGGSSHIPRLRRELSAYFPNRPDLHHLLEHHPSPVRSEESNVFGAALEAALAAGLDVEWKTGEEDEQHRQRWWTTQEEKEHRQHREL